MLFILNTLVLEADTVMLKTACKNYQQFHGNL